MPSCTAGPAATPGFGWWVVTYVTDPCRAGRAKRGISAPFRRLRWCHTYSEPCSTFQQHYKSGGSFVKRALIVAVAGVLTFGAVYGFAASLNLTTESLGAVDTTVAACQS